MPADAPEKSLPRRAFLKCMAACVWIIALPGAVYAFLKKLPVRTVETRDFTFNPDRGAVVWNDGREEAFQLVVDGLVEIPRTFSYADILNFPQKEQTSDFYCVEGWAVNGLKWGGFLFPELEKLVKPRKKARYAVFHALGSTGYKPDGLDHYVESFSLEQLRNPAREMLLAHRLNNEPLPQDHGAPLRVVSPHDLGYKSIKFVTRVEFTRKPASGWWTRANSIYPWNAPVPESRIQTERQISKS